MPAHSDQQILPYTTQQIFDLVADIESYPQFLPWCRAARVIEQGDGEFLGELVIAFKHLTESYTSRVVGKRPASAQDAASLDVTMVKGPFEYLVNRWRFVPVSGGVEVDFFLDFKFRSRLLEMMIGPLFRKSTDTMVDAFKQRAAQLYGASKP